MSPIQTVITGRPFALRAREWASLLHWRRTHDTEKVVKNELRNKKEK